ncbi:MAG: hypothetical protein IH597_02990, partial [Bacteroidales bacterium]|nr:hypothetical protein [Bacteroidales bacterium]
DINIPTKRFFLSWKVTEHPKLELIDHSSTGSFCLQKAISLGYNEIYLIGMEGRYVEEITESRPLTDREFKDYGFRALNLNKEERKLRIITSTPSENPNYFFPDYQREGDIYSLPQSHTHQKNWFTAASNAFSKDVKIFNLSKNSEIDVFDKLDFDYFTKSVINKETEIELPEHDNKVLIRTSDNKRSGSFKWKGIALRGDVTKTINSYKINPPSNNNWIASIYDGQINSGDLISCLFRFSVDHDCTLKFVLCRDGNTFFESQTKMVNITGGNHSFEIAHQFKRYHLGLRIQIGSEYGTVAINDFQSEITLLNNHVNTDITNAKPAFAKDSISASGVSLEQGSANTLPGMNHFAYSSSSKFRSLIDFLFPVNSKRRQLIRNMKNLLLANSK